MANKATTPRHVAIIMDGNGRWAEKQGVARVEGHRAGANRVIDVLNMARKFGIEFLTLYAFSTENWKRSPMEVSALMSLLAEFLAENIDDMMANNVRLRTIGRTADLPNPSRSKLLECIEMTKNNSGATLILALSYGGRAEITDGVKLLVSDVEAGKISSKKVTEELISSYMYAPDVPDPDLMIRTSGEFRLSNFLLWQLAYSELYVSQLLWPDFDEAEFLSALESFGGRERRFGGRKR